MPNIIRICRDSFKSSASSDGKDYGTLPQQVNTFNAKPGNQSITLTWVNPIDENFSGVAIIRKEESYPTKLTDGIKIYDGVETIATDIGLINGKQYYYRAFTYNSNKEYQTIYCVATSTPRNGLLLSSLPVGSKIKFGSLYGKKIVQTIANKTDDLITLITDGLIFAGAFDAKEPSNTDSDRRSYGNNHYSLSNINQWLNSNASKSNWYISQHSADTPPSSNYVDNLPYDTIAGYLNGWTADEIDKLQTVNIACGLCSIDGGGTETISAKVYLPSEREIGVGTEYSGSTQLSLFTDNNSRIAKFTAECATNRYGTAGSSGIYWVRDAHRSISYIPHIVDNNGTMSQTYAYRSDCGIRPLCNISSSLSVFMQPDDDGCYNLM